MKEVLLKLNAVELDYLKSLLIINEEKLLTRLEARIDVEDNNLIRINTNREIQNKIYILLDELEEKANKKGKKKLGLNGQGEEKEKELLGIDEVIEAFMEHEVGIEDLVEEYVEGDYESLEKYLEIITNGLEVVLSKPIDHKIVQVELMQMVEDYMEKEEEEIASKSKEGTNSLEEYATMLSKSLESEERENEWEDWEDEEEEEGVIKCNFMELMLEAGAGCDFKNMLYDTEIQSYLDHKIEMEEIIKNIITECEDCEEIEMVYDFDQREFDTVVEVAKQLAQEGCLGDDHIIEPGDVVYLSYNNDSDDRRGLYEIGIVSQIEKDHLLINLAKYPGGYVFATLDEVTLLRG